jgi:hypothetical protein
MLGITEPPPGVRLHVGGDPPESSDNSARLVEPPQMSVADRKKAIGRRISRKLLQRHEQHLRRFFEPSIEEVGGTDPA